jgi:hypothetical protein
VEKKGAAMAVTFWKLLEGSLGAGSVSRRGVRGSCRSAEPASCSFGFTELLNYENFFVLLFFVATLVYPSR